MERIFLQSHHWILEFVQRDPSIAYQVCLWSSCSRDVLLPETERYCQTTGEHLVIVQAPNERQEARPTYWRFLRIRVSKVCLSLERREGCDWFVVAQRTQRLLSFDKFRDPGD